MSHFTKLDRAQITDVSAFVAACAELGLTHVRRASAGEPVRIQDFYGKEIDVDVAVSAGTYRGKPYQLALKRNPETGKYDMVADWWGCRNVLTEAGRPGYGVQMSEALDAQLQDFLLRTTTKHAIVTRYARQGFRAEIVEDAEHNINVRLRRA